MKLREGSAADRDAVLDLRRRCFPDDDPEKSDPRFWEWEFREARYFVACDDDRVVAHIGFLPWKCGGGLAVDAMTDPAYRQRGVLTSLLRLARETADYPFLAAFQIRPAVWPAMRRNEFRPVAIAPVLVRPLSLRKARPLTRPSATLSPLAGRGAWFHWRYFENPLWQYDVTGDPDAYLVTRRTTLKGWDTLAIVDVHGPRRRTAPLLRDALGRGRKAGIRLAAALITRHHPALPLLLAHGFLPGPHRFRLVISSSDPRIVKQKWALMWGDTDHL